MEIKRLVMMLGGVLGIAAGSVVAEDPARQALIGMFDCRSHLIIGDCRISGTTQGAFDANPLPVEIEYVFNFADSNYRLRNLQERGVLLVHPDFSYTTNLKGTAIRRYDQNEHPPVTVRPFDIRSLGFFARPTEMAFQDDHDFANLRKYYLDATVAKTEQDGDQLCLTLHFKKRSADHYAVKMRVWINPEQGFTTTRMEEINSEEENTVCFTSRMGWKQVGNTWVIESFQQTAGKLHPQHSIDWQIQWRSVNQPIAPEVFTVKNLIPKGKRAMLYENLFPSNRTLELGMLSHEDPQQ